MLHESANELLLGTVQISEQVDYLVSGDTQLLRMDSHQGGTIVNAALFSTSLLFSITKVIRYERRPPRVVHGYPSVYCV